MRVSFENLAIYIYFLVFLCEFAELSEKEAHFAVERPVVTYFDKKHIVCARMWSRRYSRKDPLYYLNLEFCNAYGIGNNYSMHFYFYEFLSNTYKRSFIEIHMRMCVLIKKDPVFGAQIKKFMSKLYDNFSCPLPPGKWLMPNCTLDSSTLRHFPFLRGRIWMNMTYNPTGELVASGHGDFQITQIKLTKENKIKYPN